MKVLKMKAVRAHELYVVMNSISPAEVAKHTGGDSFKNIRHLVKIIDELETSDKIYIDIATKVDKAVEVVRDKYQTEFKKLNGDKDAEEKLLKEANSKAKKALDEATQKYGFKEAGEVETKVTIGSDDRYKLLKELIEKIGAEKWLSVKALDEVFTAIEEAKEA